MGARSVLARVEDMLKAIASIEDITRGKTADEVECSSLMQLALERAMEIVSEASRHIPDEIKALYPEIRRKNIAGIGNVLRHDYQDIRQEILWNVVEDHIPGLKVTLGKIRNELNPS